MRLEQIISYTGLSLLMEAFFMLVSAGVSAFSGFDEAFLPLLLSGIVVGILGAFPRIFVRYDSWLRRNEGGIIVVCFWVFCCFFGSLPYMMSGLSCTDAWFETVSGFTTTGASVIDDVESLPHGLLFWRMSTAWIGGIGIVVLFSLLMPGIGMNESVLSGMEISDIAMETSSMRQKAFIQSMMFTYLTLTMISTVALRVSGMGWFDAITHAMSACSTCGFSTRNASIASFGSLAVEGVLIVTMLLAGMRFTLLSGIFRKGGIVRLVHSEVTAAFLSLVAAIALVMGLELHFSGPMLPFWDGMRQSCFQAASIATTTGFATADTNVWPPFCKSLIIMASLVCGCSGSTSGGIKMDRLVTAWKVIRCKMRKMKSPNTMVSIKVDGHFVSEKQMSSVTTFIVCYGIILCTGAVLFALTGVDMDTSWSATVACLGNVGPGFGVIGSMNCYSGLPLMAKWVASLLMLVGRLEIFPILFIFVGCK